MLESNHSEENRGQVGIGTLIVFIAMVLVAAIAAGVLINTAGSLQSQASDTGSETQEAVANQIEVVHGHGDINSDTVEQVNLVIKKSAGSDVIDLESMTVQWTTEDTSETLELTEDIETDDDSVDQRVPDTDADNVFGAIALSHEDPTALTETSDRIELTIDMSHINDQNNLEGGDSATVALIDQSGAQFTYGVSVPSTFDDDADVVEV